MENPSFKICLFQDGKTVLNVIGDPSRQALKLGELVGKLDEGNPGLLTLSDNRLAKSGHPFRNPLISVVSVSRTKQCQSPTLPTVPSPRSRRSTTPLGPR